MTFSVMWTAIQSSLSSGTISWKPCYIIIVSLHKECLIDILRDISFELQRQKMVRVLKENQPESFLPFLCHALIENRQLRILETLDQGR